MFKFNIEFTIYFLLLIYILIILLSIFKKKKTLFKLAFWVGVILIIISLTNNLIIFNGDIFILLFIFFGILSYIFAIIIKNHFITKDALTIIFHKKNYLMNLKEIFFTFMSSCYEELLWRGTIFYLSHSVIGIFINSVLFSLLHISKKIKFSDFIDLTIFSIIEYLVIISTKNIMNCIIMHAVRNIYSILLNNNRKEKT